MPSAPQEAPNSDPYMYIGRWTSQEDVAIRQLHD